MTPKLPPIVLPTACTPENLRPVQQLLHLTAHRNKNQHRIAKWWSSFSILRRQLGKLVAQLEAPDAMFRARRVEIEQRVDFVREQIVPRCYLAFSALVADNQYASLGLMLMGCLARVNVLISFPRKQKDEEEEEEVKIETAVTDHVLSTEDFGEAISREELEETAVEMKKSLKTKTPKKGKEKSKEVVDLEMKSFLDIPGSAATTMSKKIAAEVAESSEVEGAAPSSPPKRGQTDKKRKQVLEHISTVSGSKTSTSKPAKKKRKKGGDAFDDLFSSLI